jgi:hypothetical protein
MYLKYVMEWENETEHEFWTGGEKLRESGLLVSAL